MPMTSCPCSTSNPAATEESTPPLMATTIRSRRSGGSRSRSDPLGLMGQLGQLEEELGAGEVTAGIRLELGRAPHADLALVGLDDLARHRQPEPGTAGLAGACALDVVEGLEDPLLLV